MAKDFKDTLNLPDTDFPMKANLARRELDFLAFWKDNSITTKMEDKNKGNPPYCLHDGPPYANGHIHIGHALNKILKDIIVKFHSMSGRYAPYVPGWDCHGLPIEHQADKELGAKKNSVTIIEKRAHCRSYAQKYIDIQRDEFIRLGVFGDWTSPYITMDFDYEADIVAEFFKIARAGYIYRGRKPVHWCSSCVTALAEAEVEYADKQSPSVYVKFKLTDDSAIKLFGERPTKNVFIVIWTTTPWTLPANLALAVHPDVDYAVVDADKEYYIAAAPLLERLVDVGLSGTIIKQIKGNSLEGIRAYHPFIDRLPQVVPADFVTIEDGTGVVHIAPGHGEDDYRTGIKYGLDIYVPVDDRGKFTASAGENLAGKFVFDANAQIIEILKNNDALIEQHTITHSYPHCWRCKKPVIFRATEQWFISMESGELKKRAVEEIEKVQWVPSWGKDRIYAMVKNRPDWCISRQRSWGVPIALLLCKDCGEAVIDEAVLDKTVARFREHGSDVWFTLDPLELLPDGYKCKKCGCGTFDKETDILDVWFDSGVSQAAVLERRTNLTWPADMYLEGSDQHRGWFQSSLLASMAVKGAAPFRTVLTHGFVVDGRGKKMSKSLGNVISPEDIIKQNGAEILRLWAASEDYKYDIRISKEILQRLTEAYRKIRNTCRFLLGNIHGLDVNYHPGDSLTELDSWAMNRRERMIKNVTLSYSNFDFHEVFHILYNFCIVDMSSFYLDIIKDRVYTSARHSVERKAAQWTMKQILLAITGLMAPILSFTAEEVWQSLKNSRMLDDESIFLSAFPVADAQYINNELDNRFRVLIKIRDVVNKALELKRQEKFIGNSLEAKVTLYADVNAYNSLKGFEPKLPTMLIVSQAALMPLDAITDELRQQSHTDDTLPELFIIVTRAEGEKCGRCWNFSTTVGSFHDEPEVCERCYPVLKHMGQT
ncbi:isoleucine--tRNA ligase [Candidatus Magnetominusculus xianensis]|uniref:Isoleucine--tRNA ligase n=1 Tax=Candidatus Magnetominusculus xianensis TaxID=1748249 RepID=A0ABR5SHK0_9BACT|nr:isoleucine--tRNA ligase [Candidatus Magnetominusculus xianensis]KWT88145.1 isoleucine--tRNA ligase [Candidatus Magnetominusculus xianensis]MBF0404451.1 isoleucine--tRNA ligase [Nitrospirota bacterium]